MTTEARMVLDALDAGVVQEVIALVTKLSAKEVAASVDEITRALDRA